MPAIVSGDCTASLAWLEDPGDWDLSSICLVCRPDRGSFVLDGRKALVSDGGAAERGARTMAAAFASHDPVSRKTFQVWFIDLVGVARHRKLRRYRRLQNLARLPATGAVVIAGPLPITGGSGSPCRALALVERS